MDTVRDSHYFLLPTQGNVYTLTKLCQTNGNNKILFASLRRKIYLLEYNDSADGCLKPSVREILFTYIPNGAEIISLDAYNRSTDSDDFFIGITIIKPNPDHNHETYLNIYSEQDQETNSVLNVESIAQNCLSIDLNFIPYQLYHTEMVYTEDGELHKELVWLLSGSDVKIHVFREDKLTHSFSESEVEKYFPEFLSLSSIVLWFDILHTSNYERRVSAFGCECGAMTLSVVDTKTSSVLSVHTNQFEGPISQVKLFHLTERIGCPDLLNEIIEKSDINKRAMKGWRESESLSQQINLVVASCLQMSAVYLNVIDAALTRRYNLEDSDKYDTSLCVCAADINMDGQKEIILGTYAQELLMYKYMEDKWSLQVCRSLEHPIHSLEYVDVTGDGVKELIVLTLGGLHVMQHSQDVLYKTVMTRVQQLINRSSDIRHKSEVEELSESEICPAENKKSEDVSKEE